MYCHIHHCHHHHCNCVPRDSKENGKALTQEELLAHTQEMKEELKDYTLDLKDQLFSYIDIDLNPVEITNTFNSLREQDTYVLKTLTKSIDDLNNSTNLSVYNINSEISDLDSRYNDLISKSDPIITPFDYGAIGDKTSHKLSEKFDTLEAAQIEYPAATSLEDEMDWCALQALFNYVASNDFNKNKTVLWTGSYYLNKGLRLIKSSGSAYLTLLGDFNFTLRDDFETDYLDSVLRLSGRGINHVGVIQGNCKNKAKFGVKVYGKDLGGPGSINFGVKLDRIFIDNALYFAVSLASNAMFNTLNFYRGNSGTSTLWSNRRDKTTYTNKVYISDNTLKNHSLFTVTDLPKASISEVPVFVLLNGYASRISEVDEVNKTVKVDPRIPGSELTGELDFIYGGGVLVTGSDSAGVRIGQMSVIGSAFGLFHAPMYPAVVDSFISEFCNISIYESGLVGGVNINTYYFEGDTIQYMCENTSSGTYGTTQFGHGVGLSFDKFRDNRWALDDSGIANTYYTGVKGLSVTNKGVRYEFDSPKYTRNTVHHSGTTLDFNKPPKHTVFTGSSLTVRFTPVTDKINDLFGYDSQRLTLDRKGSAGVEGSPTSVTFICPEGYKINGLEENVIFNGFDGAASFVITQLIADKEFIVSSINKQATLSSSGRPNLATYEGNLKNLPKDKEYFIHPTTADPRIGVETPLPTSRNEIGSGNGLTGTIVSRFPSNPTGWHYEEQVLNFHVQNETWKRIYASSTGQWSAWYLYDYTIKTGPLPVNPAKDMLHVDSTDNYILKVWTGSKWENVSMKTETIASGSTTSRPLNPAVGFQYFDTDLSKPIFWTGSKWVDSNGTDLLEE